MPGDPEEVTLDTVYAEMDKRIKAAVDALDAKWAAEMTKRFPEKKPFRIINRPAPAAS